MRAEIKDYFLTDSTPFSSAHAYKAEGGESFLRCETGKKAKEYMSFPEAKNAPTIKGSFLLLWVPWMY